MTTVGGNDDNGLGMQTLELEELGIDPDPRGRADYHVSDADFLAGEPKTLDNPLECEDGVSRRARILALFQRLDHNGMGYIDADSIVKQLDEIAFGSQQSKANPAHAPISASQAQAASLSGSGSSSASASSQSAETSVRAALENIPLGSTVMYARELVKVCDKTKDGRITFAEFEAFVRKKEQELLDLFQEIDTGNDNVIHLSELLASVREAGIDVSESELQQFIDHVDKDNDGVIDFFEWRDYLLLLPQKTTLKNVFKFYNTVSNVDFNSDAVSLPDTISASGYMLRLKYFLAGGLAGAVSRTATAPLDRLRVLLQTQTNAAQASYMSIMRAAAKSIFADGGIASFYRGNGLNIIKIFPESALKFFVFEYFKDVIRRRNNNENVESLSVGDRFIAGGIAGLVSQFAIYPIETVKTRMMAQINNDKAGASGSLAGTQGSAAKTLQPRQSAILAAFRDTWHKGGIRAFYRGCGPALVGIVPYAGIDLAVFETLKQTYIGWARTRNAGGTELHNGDYNLSTPMILTFGMVSGTCGAVLVYPLSLVRTRLQAQGTPSHPTFYTSSFDVIAKTYAREGLFGFYKGLAPTLLKVVPAVSISYWVYEHSKRALDIP
ncbi:mitochondrial carrier domain-containing protein [Entophlyctis helioformis]|nr:mitochondrial carrier domain-containing protein [Entophlyctis helioformis]